MTSTFSTRKTSTAFPGAEQAEDYVEDPLARPQGGRPRRSQQVVLPPAPAEPTADKAPASPPSTASVLFTGAPGVTTTFAPTSPATAARGWRGFFNHLGFHLTPSPAEQHDLDQRQQLIDDQTVIRQATWTRAVSVLVANPKGGTGKTPTAVLLGGTLAAIRGGSVAVLEVADDPGALTYRAEGNPRLGVGDLVRDAAGITTAGKLAGYTAPQTSFAAVIGSSTRRPPLDRDAVTAMAHVVDEFYAIRVMDSGNQPTSSAFTGALSTADVLVIPVLNAGDSILGAVRLLEHLRATGGRGAELARTAIVARLTDGRPETPAVTAEVTRLLAETQVAHVIDVPYDPHIAERGPLTLARLRPETNRAFTTVAATVVRTLQTVAAHTLQETR